MRIEVQAANHLSAFHILQGFRQSGLCYMRVRTVIGALQNVYKIVNESMR
jgi:hypothetical protein